MRKFLTKALSVTVSVAMITAAFAAASGARAQDSNLGSGDTVSAFNLQRALTNPEAAKGAMNLKYCLYGNIDLALRMGMRSKSEIAAKVAPVCYKQLAVPLRQQHLIIMSDDQIEKVVEHIAYDVIDDVAQAETEQ
jgi:hypothetical protein